MDHNDNAWNPHLNHGGVASATQGRSKACCNSFLVGDVFSNAKSADIPSKIQIVREVSGPLK